MFFNIKGNKKKSCVFWSSIFYNFFLNSLLEMVHTFNIDVYIYNKKCVVEIYIYGRGDKLSILQNIHSVRFKYGHAQTHRWSVGYHWNFCPPALVHSITGRFSQCLVLGTKLCLPCMEQSPAMGGEKKSIRCITNTSLSCVTYVISWKR